LGGQPRVSAVLNPEKHPDTDCTEPRCTVHTSNSSHAVGLGAPYGREWRSTAINLKLLPPGQLSGFYNPTSLKG